MGVDRNSGRFIGRVGALAVALGVGAAIGSMPVAWALPDDTAGPATDPPGRTSTSPAADRGSTAATGPVARGQTQSRNRPPRAAATRPAPARAPVASVSRTLRDITPTIPRSPRPVRVPAGRPDRHPPCGYSGPRQRAGPLRASRRPHPPSTAPQR